MNPPTRFSLPSFTSREILIAILLGAAGFGLNMLELQLGWGMHFVFGNALVFAFLRTQRPTTLVAAASISSARTIFLWNHPWAWSVWTLEAATLSYFIRKSTPIRVDILFWLLAGVPMLIATYGGIMGMDHLSLWLVIAKQMTNGVLNVALGELVYFAFLSVQAARGPVQLRRMPIEAFVMMILMSIILIPTTVYLALDAPTREAGARGTVARSLDDELQLTNASMTMWQESRSQMIAALVSERRDLIGIAHAPVPTNLRREFEQIVAFDPSGRPLWSMGDKGSGPANFPSSGNLLTGSEARIVELSASATSGNNRIALLVPAYMSGKHTYALATMRPDTLKRIIIQPGHPAPDGLLLLSPSSHYRIIRPASESIIDHLRSMPAHIREGALEDAVLLSRTGYGNAVMSDLRDALMVRAIRIKSLPGWEAIAVARLSGEVLKARQGQSSLFMALSVFVVLITIAGTFLARRIETSLRELAQSAADLAMAGTGRGQIDRLVISELSDISINIATVGSLVARERGALVSYQRRLRSIAAHSPVLVYAFEVIDDRLGQLVYISDAVEKILGYTAAEAAQPEWWSNAIHPEDRDHFRAAYSDLHPGKIVRVEYRFRHKQGHYVWVYDSCAIEVDPLHGNSEAVGLILDISERKQAAEQLLQADKMASLGRMVAGVAHELNQPLNFIKMASLNLQERTKRELFDVKRFAAKLDDIISHVGRASAIILQMRVFGRKPTEEPYPVEVKQSVDAVLTMIRNQFFADGVRVEAEDCDPNVTVRALPVLLEQVLLNLLLNANDAIRARQAGANKQDGWIRIGVKRHGRKAEIVVEDNGTGIKEEVLPVLFEPFFTTKPPKEGTGLGLSISYGIVRDLGGTLRAENTGTGARFIMDLPLCA